MQSRRDLHDIILIIIGSKPWEKFVKNQNLKIVFDENKGWFSKGFKIIYRAYAE